MKQDLHDAFRSLRRHRASYGLMLVVLGTSFAAAAAITSLVDAAVLRPLPYEEPERLVEIRERPLVGESGAAQRVLAGNFAELVQTSRAFEEIAALRSTGKPITGLAEPMNPLLRRSSASYFRLLRVEPLLGRAFLPEEDRPGGAPVVILSHEFWQTRLGGDPGALGRTIELDFVPHEIVGVLPAGFRDPLFTGRPALWLPLALSEAELRRDASGRPQRLTAVFARLAEGVSLAAARAEVERLGAEMEARFAVNEGRVLTVRSLHEEAVRGYRPALLLLFAAVLLVLAVACGNFAHLLLARALERRREIALRLALGASRRRIARKLLVESLLLALAASILGLGLATLGLGPLLTLLPEGFGVPRLDAVAVDARVVVFIFGLAALCGILFGLAPLGQALRPGVESELIRGSERTGSRSGRRLRRLLVAGEIALCLALLVSAGRTATAFAQLARAAPGFDPEGVFTLRTSARGAEYGSRERWGEFHERVRGGLRALSGVEAVGAVDRLSIRGPFEGAAVQIPSREERAPSASRAMVFTVTPGFFEAMGMPLLAGRTPAPSDGGEAERVAILGREAARRFFGTAGKALHRTVILEADEPLPLRIVGVVGDVRHGDTTPAPRPVIYLPHAQNPMPTLTVVLRTTLAAPASLAREAERTIRGLSRDAPVYNLAPLAELLHAVDWQPRFLLQLLSGFAFLALVLTASGLYAVLTFLVAGQAREIGLRMALGARRAQILGRVLRQALAVAALGLLAGAPLALAAGRLLRRQWSGISGQDPLIWGGVAVLLFGVVLAASYIPARRAARVDPVRALSGD